MAARGFVCNRYPHLKIGERIAFQGGLFVTDDPALQAIVESNELYGVHIHNRETAEEISAAAEMAPAEAPPAPSRTAEVEEGRVRRGSRGTK